MYTYYDQWRHYEGGPKYPFSAGNITTAQYMFIGEAPGGHEEINNSAFTGKTGLVLRNIITNSSVKVEDCYFTNVALERPPGNKFALLDVDKVKEVYLPLLKQRIIEFAKHNGKVVFMTGGEAMLFLCDEKGITEKRGTPMTPTDPELKNLNLLWLPILHPSFLVRGNMQLRYITRLDVQKGVRLAKDGARPFKPTMLLYPKYEEIEAYVNDVLFPNRHCLVLDIETGFKKMWSLTTIGLGVKPDEAMSIPLFLPDYEFGYKPESMVKIFRLLDKLFSDEGTGVVAQNARFDLYWLMWYGFRFHHLYMDTMTAFGCLYPELPKNLALLSSIVTDLPYHKSMPKFTFGMLL